MIRPSILGSRAASAIFLASGSAKILGHPTTVRQFRSWGYPKWLRVAIGAVEIQCALALLYPPSARAAALALLPVMAGAAYTHAKTRNQRLLTALPLLTGAGLVWLAQGEPGTNKANTPAGFFTPDPRRSARIR